MDVFEIDCRQVRSFSEFVAEVNLKFLSRIPTSIPWNGNLDAFNDFLSWPGRRYQVVLKGTAQLEKALSEKKNDDEELTLFDHVIDIFLSHSDLVRLHLK